jgi:hypothetical protein
MFIKSEKYSVLQAACGIPIYFTKLKPIEEKIADITSASRSNRISSIQAVAISEIISAGQSVLIKPLDGTIEGLSTIDTSFIGTHKVSSIEYTNSSVNLTYYQNLPDLITTNIAAEVYSIPNIDPCDNYLIEFSVESLVPSSAEVTVRPRMYVVGGNESFTPTTTIELKSKFSTSAKALLKMVVKNALTNKILRNEYIEVVMSDSDTKPCEIITEKPIENTYVYLNKNNDWTYNYQGYTLAQFIPYNKNINTSIRLTQKNNQLLPNRGDQNRFKIVVDPVKLSNKKVTIDQIRTAVLQQFNNIQNYSIFANTINKSYDIIFKDVFLEPQDLNELVVAVVPPVTGTPVKLSDVAEAVDDGVISDRSEIPGISLLRWNNNYIGELHFDKNIYLNDPIIISYGVNNLSGTINNFYLGLNSLSNIVTPTPTPTISPSPTPTRTPTPSPTPLFIPDNIYFCDFWENYFNGLYTLSYTDDNGKGVFIHNIIDVNDEDTGVNTIMSYDTTINRWILSYCGVEELAEDCFAPYFKSSSTSPFGSWVKIDGSPSSYTPGSVGINICDGMPTNTPTSTPMMQASTPTPTLTPTDIQLMSPTGINIVCNQCIEGDPNIANVNISWSYQEDPLVEGIEIHVVNFNSEIINIKTIYYPTDSTDVSLPSSNIPVLFRIRSFGNQKYSNWIFYPQSFRYYNCCPIFAPTSTPQASTPTPTSTSVPSTPTPTSTPLPATPTATSTSTPLPPTSTPTSTPLPPTSTPTSTPIPPSSTPTSTAVPPTSTPTPTSSASIEYVSSSLEKYSCATDTSVTNLIPSSTQSGDLIVALLMRRSSITNSSSFSLLDEIENPGSSTGQYTSVYTKIANNTDANTNLTFTQSGAGRMGLAVVVLRSSNNNFNIENISKNSSSTDIPLLPSVISSGNNRIAISMITNTFTNIGFPPCDLPNYLYAPSGYQYITNSSLCSYADGESTPQCQQLRMGAAYKTVSNSGNIHSNSETFSTNVTDRRIGQISFIVSPA